MTSNIALIGAPSIYKYNVWLYISILFPYMYISSFFQFIVQETGSLRKWMPKSNFNLSVLVEVYEYLSTYIHNFKLWAWCAGAIFLLKINIKMVSKYDKSWIFKNLIFYINWDLIFELLITSFKIFLENNLGNSFEF